MPRLSLNETTTFRWSFEEDVVHYSAAGIPALGVWRHKLSDCGIEKAQQLLSESGMAVSHLHWAGGFTGSDGRSFRASVDDALEALRTATQLNAPTLVVYSGPRAGHTWSHAQRLFKEALKEIAPAAERTSVQIAIEPMHSGCAKDFTFINGLDEALAMSDAVGSAAIKLLYDTYQLAHEEHCVDRIPDIADRVALVQLGDAREPPQSEQARCRLGDGMLPLAEIVRAFLDAGYDGDFDVELLGEEIETIDYRDLVTHAKDAYEQLVGSA